MTDSSPVPGVKGVEGLTVVGRGGFATVYRGHQTAFRRDVAVKVLQRSELGGEDRQRFERECQAMGAVSDHPGIVTLYDAGFTDDGRPYLVIAYLSGGTLHDRLVANGPMAWQDVTRLGVQLSGALETAHRAGVLHRDIKPANVLHAAYGDQLSDFGIARIQGGHETRAGVVTASVNHAAPEILDGQPPTPQADVYGLASTLYEALNGRAAFDRVGDESLLPLIHRVMTEPPADLGPRGVPDQLAAVIRRAMAKDPAERHATAEEFGAALQATQAALGVPVTELVIVGGLPGLTPQGASPPPPPLSPPPPSPPPPTPPPPGTAAAAAAAAGTATTPGEHDPGPAAAAAETASTPGDPGGAAATTMMPADASEIGGADETSVMASAGAGPRDAASAGRAGPPLAGAPPAYGSTGPDERSSGGPRQAVLIFAGLAAAIAVVIGALFVFSGDGNGGGGGVTDTTATTAGTTETTVATDTTTADTTATTSPPTETTISAADALQQLQLLVSQDAAAVDAIAEQWVPQLSAKREGLVVGGQTFGPAEILADHLERRTAYGAVLVDGGTYNFRIDDQQMNGWYITIVPMGFADADGALQWCRDQNIDRGNCIAKLVSSSVLNGTTKLNP